MSCLLVRYDRYDLLYSLVVGILARAYVCACSALQTRHVPLCIFTVGRVDGRVG